MHIVIIEDEDSNIEDVVTFCSDFCARTHPEYMGWYGAQEASPGDVCARCGEELYLPD